jgi:hypothetical protein
MATGSEVLVARQIRPDMKAGSETRLRMKGAQLDANGQVGHVTEETSLSSDSSGVSSENIMSMDSNVSSEVMSVVGGLWVHSSEPVMGPMSSTSRGETGGKVQDYLPPAVSSPPAVHLPLAGLASNNIYAILPIEEVRDLGDDQEGQLAASSVASEPASDASPDAVCVACGLEENSNPTWRRRERRRALGDISAHARYLQYVFRRTCQTRPGCWSRGGMRQIVWYRPVATYGCRGGLLLASDSEFSSQRARAQKAQRWYQNYRLLLQRLSSGRTPTALVTFCSQGGTSAGVLRAGGAAHGQDLRPQPRYESKFGASKFSLGDSSDAMQVRVLRQKTGAFVTLASPPCKAYSTALFRGVPSEEPLISATRDALRSAGGLYAIENVVGAKGSLEEDASLLRGCYFGERVDRPRLFESNFKLHVDEYLRKSGNSLRERTCLGLRRRWRRLDPFGRPVMHDCCGGNIWAVQGDKPLRCSVAECERAMGVDSDHMDYVGLAQAIPPAYGS